MTRLTPWWRRTLVTVHVGASVGLLGVDAGVLGLAVVGVRGADPDTVYPAAALLGTVLLVPLAVTGLVTGLLLGWLTPWGLFRHWWVTAKLALTLAGTVAALVVLRPALDRLAVAADPAGRVFLVRASSGACVVLLVALVLSVHKPFGRIRR